MPVFAAQSTGSSDPFESVSNFFDSGLWSFISLTLRVFVVVMWLALVWWTYQDARRRTDNPALIAGAVALAVFLPFLGALVYLTIRPPESLLETRERELELIALEQRLGDLGDHEGQRIVGRILGRDAGDLAEPANQGMLRQAGVATRDELRDLDLRITELEFRLRNVGRDRGERGTPQKRQGRPAEAETSSSDEGDRTMIRRIRRSVSPDPEATVE
ncbi:MAG: hypothetical protein KDC36_02555 [Thermoleophilia bacterium]|nr:hypothetical protein [Thermoleophilia bacterium]